VQKENGDLILKEVKADSENVLQPDSKSASEHSAALQIQKQFRGNRARREVKIACRYRPPVEESRAEAILLHSAGREQCAPDESLIAEEVDDVVNVATSAPSKQDLVSEEESALRIQKRYRGNQARQALQQERVAVQSDAELEPAAPAEQSFTSEEQAAVYIQAQFRGNKVRQELLKEKFACNDDELGELARLANPMSPKKPLPPSEALLQEQMEMAEDLATLSLAEHDAVETEAQDASKINADLSTATTADATPGSLIDNSCAGADETSLGALGDVTHSPTAAEVGIKPPSSARGQSRNGRASSRGGSRASSASPAIKAPSGRSSRKGSKASSKDSGEGPEAVSKAKPKSRPRAGSSRGSGKPPPVG
jgi:hypothetical protein